MSLLATAGTYNTVPTWTGSVPAAGHGHGGSRGKRPPRRLLTEPATKTVVMELAEGTWDIEVPEPVPGWFHETMEALERLSGLHENWDSYSARPVKDDTLLGALDLAYQILGDDAEAPVVVPTSDSGVQLEWHDDGTELEIRVRPNGEISAFRFDEAAGEGNTIEQITVADLKPLIDFLNR